METFFSIPMDLNKMELHLLKITPTDLNTTETVAANLGKDDLLLACYSNISHAISATNLAKAASVIVVALSAFRIPHSSIFLASTNIIVVTITFVVIPYWISCTSSIGKWL